MGLGEFLKSSDKGETHLVTLGYDIKITPDGNPYIIEINGQASGLKGLEKLKGADARVLRDKSRFKAYQQYSDYRRDENSGTLLRDIEISEVPLLIEYFDINARLDDYIATSSDEERQRDNNMLYDKFAEWLLVSKKSPLAYPGKLKQLGLDTAFRDKDVGIVFLTDPEVISTNGTLKDLHSFMEYFFSDQPLEKRAIIGLPPVCSGEAFWCDPRHFKIIMNDVAVCRLEQGLTPVSVLRKIINRTRLELSVYRGMENPPLLESMTHDKIHQKKYIHEKHTAPYYAGSQSHWDQFMQNIRESRPDLVPEGHKYPYVVIKPRSGCQGEGISFLSLSDVNLALVQSGAALGGQGDIIEAFIPSKDLVNPATGKPHDGCMRYLLDILVKRNGDTLRYKPIYEGAYWRLAPQPVDSDAKLENRLKANLAQNAIPAECTSDDLKTARHAIKESLDLIVSDPRLFEKRD